MKTAAGMAMVVGLCATLASGEDPAAKVSETRTRVGVYDSRAIALAYFFSPAYNADEGKKGVEAEAALKKAKTEGDAKRIAEAQGRLDTLVKAVAIPRHKQVFSTAPVDDLLVYIKDQIPEITKSAGVGTLVSKWDRTALARLKSAELMDVTVALVDAFHPTADQRKAAMDVQKREPMPLEQAEKVDWTKE